MKNKVFYVNTITIMWLYRLKFCILKFNRALIVVLYFNFICSSFASGDNFVDFLEYSG